MIDNILEICSLDAHLALDCSDTISLAGLLRLARGRFSDACREKGLELTLECPEDAPPFVSNEKLLWSILSNLLSNAIKFTEKGSVVVSLSLPPAAGGRLLEMSVADTGIGISKQDLGRIRDPFFQVDMTSTRGFDGAGLGLSICERATRLLGAEIVVESEVGRGSRFKVLVPVLAS